MYDYNQSLCKMLDSIFTEIGRERSREFMEKESSRHDNFS